MKYKVNTYDYTGGPDEIVEAESLEFFDNGQLLAYDGEGRIVKAWAAECWNTVEPVRDEDAPDDSDEAQRAILP